MISTFRTTCRLWHVSTRTHPGISFYCDANSKNISQHALNSTICTSECIGSRRYASQIRVSHRKDVATRGGGNHEAGRHGNSEKGEHTRVNTRVHPRIKSLQTGKQGPNRAQIKGITPKPSNGPRDKQPVPEKFEKDLKLRLDSLKLKLLEVPLLESLQKEDQERSRRAKTPAQVWEGFVRLANAKHPEFSASNHAIRVNQKLRDEYLYAGGISALDARIKHEFYDHLLSTRFSPSETATLRKVADLRYPSEWFPATRRLKRTVHLHVGPTNSGKTYHALKRLEQAETGVYAGPLRLLAHEVYAKLNANGKRCALITGEERRNALAEDGSELSFVDDTIKIRSCTVEMVPLNMSMDVAVLDEIQMIADEHRGWAWTQAFLGLCAKELHLCGEERSVPLIKELCAMVGDNVQVHRYNRLSPLQMDEESIQGDLRNLKKGDAVISFSVMGIHALRREIQAVTGKRAAIVYGSLPPETRAQQARLFNDPDNDYDFLVASDAVGMGLNLAIKRVIFEASYKFNGVSVQRLRISDIKQIGGRAGRYRVAGQESNQAALADGTSLAERDTQSSNKNTDSVGLITTLEPFDFPIVSNAMKSEPQPIRTAGILPPIGIVERFSRYFPKETPFSYIMVRLNEMGMTQSRFHLCALKDQLKLARCIDDIPGLSIADRAVMCAAPSGKMTESVSQLVSTYATCIATQEGGNILDIPGLPLEILDEEITGDREQLKILESLHAALVVYLWLSYRFAGVFTTRPLALHIKTLVEEKIEIALGKMGLTEAQRKRAYEERRRKLEKSESAESKPTELVKDDETIPLVLGNDDALEQNVRFNDESDVPYIDPAEEEQVAASQYNTEARP